MPAVTHLSSWEEKEYSRVEGDKDCDDLLQEMCRVTGRRWLIQVRRWFVSQGLLRHAREAKSYTLYLECHGEYQVISLVHPGGSSVFHGSGESREHAMNYMLGYLSGQPREGTIHANCEAVEG